MLFVCEDNQWSATTRTAGMSAGEGAAARAAAAGVPSETVDGMDVEAVHAAAGRLVADVRAGRGPRLLHAKTYRFKGHVSVDPAAYRDPAEVARAVEGDPLGRTRARLVALGVAPARIDAAMAEARAEIASAIATAGAAPWPDPGAAYTDIQDTGAGRWA
jgi:TPP-dependent pyruvate/acetoin dehydrogenase alpha subunit